MNEETASNDPAAVSPVAAEDPQPGAALIPDPSADAEDVATTAANTIDTLNAPLECAELSSGASAIAPGAPEGEIAIELDPVPPGGPEGSTVSGDTEGSGAPESPRAEDDIPPVVSWAAVSAHNSVASGDEPTPAPQGNVDVGAHVVAIPEAETPLVREVPVRRSRPDWMMAFITGWAGLRSAWQVVDVLSRTDLMGRERILAFGGYGAIAAGLVLCCGESLLRGKISSRATRQTILGVLVLLLAFGVGCLFLLKDPDPTRGRI